MNSDFRVMPFVGRICSIRHRQLENEKRASRIILGELRQRGVPSRLHKFQTSIPVFKDTFLTVDGKKIPAIATSFVNGEITGNHSLVSSLISSQKFLYETNINFNPQSSCISRSNHYFAPSLAIRRSDVLAVSRGKKIKGRVKVSPVSHQSTNILVGNAKNPRVIVFAHYDSIDTGATDNASGVGVMMGALLKDPRTLQRALYVFAGNEELSYDEPFYWGRGFRVFERKYKTILERCEEIIVVDSLGNGKTVLSRDPRIVPLAFPITHLKEWAKKIKLMYGDMDKLMRVYHSEDDTMGQLKEKYLVEGMNMLIKEIQSA